MRSAMSRRHVEVIAEAGVNHNGSLTNALALVDAAVAAGADVVKFQTFSADSLVSRAAPMAQYQQRNTASTKTQYELLKALELSVAEFQEIKHYCKSRDIEFLSTPFDLVSLRFLVDELGVSRLKIASGEITNGPLLLAAARCNVPLIISTGMAEEDEINHALAVAAFGYEFSDQAQRQPQNLAECIELLNDPDAQKKLQQNVSLLHCTSQYPAPYSALNLAAMQTMAARWHLPVGYSDHSEGIAIPAAAVALGATLIEKHLTLDNNLPGPDHKASLEPNDFSAMVKHIRAVELSLGSAIKQRQNCEQDTAKVARKSLVAATDIRSGEPFSPHNVDCQRPGEGMSPMAYWQLLSRKATRDYRAGDVLHE